MKGKGGFCENFAILSRPDLKRAIRFFELVQAKELGGSGASKEDVATYERALDVFVKRQWNDCLDLLKTLPHDDEAAQWLIRKTLKFQKNPPADGMGRGEIKSLSK